LILKFLIVNQQLQKMSYIIDSILPDISPSKYWIPTLYIVFCPVMVVKGCSKDIPKVGNVKGLRRYCDNDTARASYCMDGNASVFFLIFKLYAAAN
jgi:hypothetical protein